MNNKGEEETSRWGLATKIPCRAGRPGQAKGLNLAGYEGGALGFDQPTDDVLSTRRTASTSTLTKSGFALWNILEKEDYDRQIHSRH